MRVGLAQDAWPIPGASVDYLVSVENKPTAKLSAQISLVDEVGGRVAGALEAREKAKLRIDLSNNGDIEASDLKINIINLSGSQVQLAHESVKIDNLAVGERKSIFVEVKASKLLVSSELSFGVLASTDDLAAPFRQLLKIKSLPLNRGKE